MTDDQISPRLKAFARGVVMELLHTAHGLGIPRAVAIEALARTHLADEPGHEEDIRVVNSVFDAMVTACVDEVYGTCH